MATAERVARVALAGRAALVEWLGLAMWVAEVVRVASSEVAVAVGALRATLAGRWMAETEWVDGNRRSRERTRTYGALLAPVGLPVL
jgi:hypothetical protein